MPYQDLIRTSIEVVLDWDIPNATFGQAVMAQAEAMVGPRGD